MKIDQEKYMAATQDYVGAACGSREYLDYKNYHKAGQSMTAALDTLVEDSTREDRRDKVEVRIHKVAFEVAHLEGQVTGSETG